MTDNLSNWINQNKLSVKESNIDDSTIITIEGVGDFLYLQPFDGKVIDEDFSFLLSDEEFDLLDEKKVNYILFEFGTKFYYSGLKQSKNRYNELIYKPEFNDFKYLGKSSEPFVCEFAHLGVHTEYEILNGSGNTDDWAKKGAFMGLKAMGICDKDTMAGVLAFQSSCEKKGVKSIIGETVTVAINYDETLNVQETFELKLYILNNIGWTNLLLINKAINVDFDGFIPDYELYKLGAGLCCVIPKDSEFNYRSANEKSKAIKLIKKYKESFDKVYYQIDTVEFNSPTLFKKHLQNIDNYLLYYRKMIKPLVINDSYYLDEESNELKSMVNKIDGKVNPESLNQYLKSVAETISSYEEWLDDTQFLFESILMGMENTVDLTDSIDFKINTGERKLPQFEVKDVNDLFFQELERGVEERLGHLPKKKLALYMERLEVECGVIVPNGLVDYFMILWDIIKNCRDNDVIVGTGRGSVCGSLIAYCLYITDVDPLEYGLMFERFLNETRVSGERAKSADSMPDIDVDFPTEFRDEVKNYIKDKYGYAYTCSIGTYTRMKLKTCLKDFAKVKGLPFDLMNKLTKDIDDQIEYTWGDLIEYASKSKALFKFVQEYPDIIHLTKFAMGQCKAASVHPSAVIIVPKFTERGEKIDIFGWLPVKKVGNVLVSEWEGKYIDKSGFLKEDILGLTQLDKFKGIINLIKKNHGLDIDMTEIPLDDENTFKYFKRGWNEDVFQFGTTGLMNYCRQVKPDNLEHLIAMTSVFRPGPMESNAHQDFSDIKNGKKKPHFDYGLQTVTEPTSGLYIYQEQIMSAVNVLGGLTLVQADQLRTYMKKKDKKAMAALSEQFVKGAVEKGCSEKEALEIWDKLDKFSGYGFNKSHAAAYSIMSYWSQWFKVNYPLEFWTTSLQNAKEAEVPYRLAELKKTGIEIEIRPPDVNYSEGNFTCDIKENRIFFSLTKIKGVGESAVSHLLDTRREGGQFFSLEEFMSRVPSKVNKGIIEKLIIAGAFDLIEGVKAPRERKKVLKKFLEYKGFSLPDKYEVEDSKNNSFWVFEQKELTGFGEVDYATMIKYAIPNKRIAKLYTDGLEFANVKENSEIAIAGKLIYYVERQIKNGTMCTVNIDSNNTIITVTFWPDAYERLGEKAEDLKNKVVVINGRVKKDKYRNTRVLYSDDRTKLYIVN